MRTYTIAKDLLPLFEEKLEKFAKKFEKYGCYTYNKLDTFVCEDKSDRRYGYTLINIELDAAYKVGDYEFVASLEWVDDVNENLIKKISDDVYVPAVYKTRRDCDHCKTNHNRKYTIVLKNKDTGNYIQVGKSCVRDYIGVDLGNYMSYLSFFDNMDDFVEQHMTNGLIRLKKQYNVDEILCQAVEETKRNGYISKSTSIERDCDSTSTRVYLALVEARHLDGQLIYPKYKVEKETKDTLVNEIKNFYLDASDKYSSFMENDYVKNIKTLMQTDWVGADKIGLVVSAIGTKLRIENDVKERDSKPVSNFVGSVGERVTINSVKPICIFSTDSEYGFFYIYKFTDVNGNEFVWKTSKNLDVDATFDVVATIKNHDEYRGTKQTEITRARTTVVC